MPEAPGASLEHFDVPESATDQSAQSPPSQIRHVATPSALLPPVGRADGSADNSAGYTDALPGSFSIDQTAWRPSDGRDGPPIRTDHTAHNALSTGSRSLHAPLRGVRFVEPSFFSCGGYVPPFPFRLHLLSTRVCHSAKKKNQHVPMHRSMLDT